MADGGVRAVFELVELGVAMHRQRLRRNDPALTDAELDRLVAEWRIARPGAVHGDAAGVPSHRFVDPA